MLKPLGKWRGAACFSSARCIFKIDIRMMVFADYKPVAS